MAAAPLAESSEYRIAPALSARIIGVCLIAVAVVVVVATVVALLLHWPPRVLLLVPALGLALTALLAAVLRRRVVVNLMPQGYRVSLLRGSGVRAARWADVQDAVAATRLGEKCVVIRLRDGRSTTIPMSALQADPDAFARDLQVHLRQGSGLRPLA